MQRPSHVRGRRDLIGGRRVVDRGQEGRKTIDGDHASLVGEFGVQRDELVLAECRALRALHECDEVDGRETCCRGTGSMEDALDLRPTSEFEDEAAEFGLVERLRLCRVAFEDRFDFVRGRCEAQSPTDDQRFVQRDAFVRIDVGCSPDLS